MKKYFKNKKLIVWVLIVVIFFLGIYLLIQNGSNKKIENIPTPPISIPQVLGDQDNFISFSPLPRSKVSGKLIATGVIKGGYFFEGNVQIKIVNAQGKELRSTYGTATTDWMTAGPVTFETNLDFTDLPAGPGYIKIIQDDPSGGESNGPLKEIWVPLIINE